VNYAKAKWLSYTYKVPLLYQPFSHSDQLQLDRAEPIKLNLYIGRYEQNVAVHPSMHLQPNNSISTLYVSLARKGDQIMGGDVFFKIISSDAVFKTLIQQMLTPSKKVKPLALPKNRITVAVHVRKGSGPDTKPSSKQFYDTAHYFALPLTHFTEQERKFSDRRCPHRFLPDQFYVDQIILLSELLDDQPLYVYLFTDDKNPDELAKKYAEKIKKPNITFAHHPANNPNKIGDVLTDYYNMAQFDCLIRPGSNFSRAIQLFGNHKLVIYPQEARWHADAIVADGIDIMVYNKRTNQHSFFSRHTHERSCSIEMKEAVKNAFLKG
jgi:hypothetical protein